MTSAARIVSHVLGTEFHALPKDAVQAAKIFILDTLGVGVSAQRNPEVRAARGVVDCWGVPQEGRSAHILGTHIQAPTASAAFINAFQIHCQEFDCVHEAAVVHPMATIFAAALAEAERTKTTGAQFILAIVLGVDIATGLGVAAAKAPIRFFRPATAGIFGATLAIARMRNLDQSTAESALGLALCQAAGTMQAHVEGTPALAIQIANAARAAHIACDLAMAGIVGPRDVFEGPFGYLTLFEQRHDLAPVLESLGKVWRICEVSHKPFPTGRAAHGGIMLLQDLRNKGLSTDNIVQIELSAPPLIKRLVGRPYSDAMTANYARLCFPYIGALVLANGDVALSDFSNAALQSFALQELCARISVVENSVIAPGAFTPQAMKAKMRNGDVVYSQILALYGSPDMPMSEADYLRKFRRCMEFGLGETGVEAVEKVIALVASFEEWPDASVLVDAANGRPFHDRIR